MRRREPLGEPRPRLFRMKPKGPESALINNLPLLIEDVNPFRPPTIHVVGGVVHIVNSERQREVETLCKVVGDRHTLREAMRLRIAHALIHIRLHLPFILRMRLADVDREEIGAILVIVVHLHQVADLAAEGRSGVAAENQNHRARAHAVVKAEGFLAIERVDLEIGSGIADM